MNKVSLFVFASLLGFIAGCYVPQFMPATNIQCRVVDTESKSPIVGAELFMVYRGNNDETTKLGPFRSNADGQASIKVDRQAVWQSGADAGFGGGYTRHIEVHAPGYEDSGFWENFNRGQLEKKAPFVFELQPFRNQFGAVRLLHYDMQNNTVRIYLEILDGPHAGERVILPVILQKPASLYFLVSKKLYLRKSLEGIRDEEIHQRVTAHDFKSILREGFPDEHYDPKKIPPNQPSEPTAPSGHGSP